MDVWDFVRCLGILADNAMEAALDTERPWVEIVLLAQDECPLSRTGKAGLFFQRYFFTIAASSSQWASMSLTSLHCVRQRSRFCFSRLIWKYTSPSR